MSRVALVTGASGGIGSATVRRLLADGVVVTGIDLAPSRVQEAGYHHLVGDVRELEVLRAAVTGVIRREGRLDVVVCAAAVMQGGRPVWETDVEQARQLWQDDVATVWQAARACIPVMLEGPDPGGCRFVALASVAGERGLFHLGGYGCRQTRGDRRGPRDCCGSGRHRGHCVRSLSRLHADADAGPDGSHL